MIPEMPSSGRPAWLRRLFVTLGLLLAVFTVLVALAAGALGIWRSLPFALPTPGGSYPVSQTSLNWTDSQRPDPFRSGPPVRRSLPILVWYPAGAAGGPRAPYLPVSWQRALNAVQGTSWLRRRVSSVRTAATLDAPLAPGPHAFPVIVFTPGLGPLPNDYTALLEDLASRGYVVVAFTPTGSASVSVLPGGVVVPATSRGNPPDPEGGYSVQHAAYDPLVRVWVDDLRFILSQLETPSTLPGRFHSRLDLRQVALLGHSLGGAAALNACALDRRCRAAVNLDGDLYGDATHLSIPHPVLLIVGKDGGCDNAICSAAQRERERYFARSPQTSRTVIIRGAGHFNFSDLGLMLPAAVGRGLGLTGSINARRALALTSDAISGFLDPKLQGQPGPSLQGAPEVQVETR